MNYPTHLYRPCEVRSVRESCDRQARADHPRNQSVKALPRDHKAAPFHTREGIRA